MRRRRSFLSKFVSKGYRFLSKVNMIDSISKGRILPLIARRYTSHHNLGTLIFPSKKGGGIFK